MSSQNCIRTMEPPAGVASRPPAWLDRGLPSPAAVLKAAWRTLIRWQARSEERWMLARMEDHRLDDIGLGREDVLAEARKPFWHA